MIGRLAAVLTPDWSVRRQLEPELLHHAGEHPPPRLRIHALVPRAHRQVSIRAGNEPSRSFTIMEEAPARAFFQLVECFAKQTPT